MPIAYPQLNQADKVLLSKEELASLLYHDIFEYPLTMAELVRWSAGQKTGNIKGIANTRSINSKNGFFFVRENEGIILKRLMRKRISARKFEIAKKGAKVISFVPTIQMVGITGALAMENASDEADIDLIIITKRNTLWLTRLFVYFSLFVFRFSLRRPKDKTQRDKLCLNMWLDESDLIWDEDKRNIYTAHEIAQVRPLINRDQTYEKFLLVNTWIADYWPNAVKNRNNERTTDSVKGIMNKGKQTLIPNSFFLIRFFEWVAFRLQYAYMRKKITRETVTKTRALFHPVDWGEYILSKLEA